MEESDCRETVEKKKCEAVECWPCQGPCQCPGDIQHCYVPGYEASHEEAEAWKPTGSGEPAMFHKDCRGYTENETNWACYTHGKGDTFKAVWRQRREEMEQRWRELDASIEDPFQRSKDLDGLVSLFRNDT